MSLEALAETAPIIERLNNLEQYLPNQARVVYKFGKSLAYTLGEGNGKLSINTFYLNFERAFLPLIDPKNPLKSLIESEHIMDKLSEIARVTCPEEFAKGVEEFHKLN